MTRSLEFFGWICCVRAWRYDANVLSDTHNNIYFFFQKTHTRTHPNKCCNSDCTTKITTHRNDIDACLSRVSMKRPNEMWRRHQQPTALHIYYQMALSFNSHLPSVFFFRNSFRCRFFRSFVGLFCDFRLVPSFQFHLAIDSSRPMFTVLCFQNEEDSAIHRVSFGALKCTVHFYITSNILFKFRVYSGLQQLGILHMKSVRMSRSLICFLVFGRVRLCFWCGFCLCFCLVHFLIN